MKKVISEDTSWPHCILMQDIKNLSCSSGRNCQKTPSWMWSILPEVKPWELDKREIVFSKMNLKISFKVAESSIFESSGFSNRSDLPIDFFIEKEEFDVSSARCYSREITYELLSQIPKFQSSSISCSWEYFFYLFPCQLQTLLRNTKTVISNMESNICANTPVETSPTF